MEFIKIEQLKQGDEVIIPSGSSFKYLKIIGKPGISYHKDSTGKRVPRTRWGDNQPRYKSLKVSTRMDIKEHKYPNGYIRKEKVYKCQEHDHNFERYIDLNHTDMMLVKREMEDL